MLAVPFFIMHFDSHVESSQSLCPHKMLFGLPCPGCGITKSLIFFYRGDLWKSLSYHILGPFVVAACVALLVLLVAEIVTGREYGNKVFFSRRLAYSLAAVLIVYHVVRVAHFVSVHSFDEILRESIWRT